MEVQCAESCPLSCPTSAGSVYDPDADETVCRGCGSVMDVVRHAGQDTAPAGSNTPTPRRELGGYMGGAGGPGTDVDGRAVRDAGGIHRQHTWHNRTAQRGTPDSVRRCMVVIAGLADKLSLPTGVRMDATEMSVRACKIGLTGGRTAAAVAAAAVLLASRKAGLARSLHDVEDAADVTKLGMHYRMLCRGLEEQPPPPSPMMYLPKTSGDLELPPSVERAAARMLTRLQSTGHTAGRSPVVLAAAAVYAASSMLQSPGLSAEAVGRVAGVSSVSIRNTSKLLADAGAAPPGR